ncbi:MAG: PadR family transcriptional regulator [Candidatus Aenigmatarchaeota archaeon]
MKNQSSMSKYFILSELSKREMHGYELITRLEKIMGKKPSPSQIYPVLGSMKSLGYVAVRVKNVGRKKLKYYKLTNHGLQFFRAMNKKFELMIRSALKEKIKVCAHCSCEIWKGAYSKNISGKRLYFCCVSCAGSYKG